MSIIFLVLFSNILSSVLPLLVIGLSLALVVWVWLEVINRSRQVFYAASVDILELMARRSAQIDDHLGREVQLLEASYQMRIRRLELQGKRLELLDQ